MHKQHYKKQITLLTFIVISRKRSNELQEHLSDYLRRHIKGKTKQATAVSKVQSVLCDDALCLKRVIMV